jgi:hypothetical protein
MLQRHDWVTLYVNGVRYLEKAPLMYWGVATSYTAVRRQRVEHPLSAHAGCAGNDPLHLWIGALGARQRRWIRFGAGAGNRARAISLYALSDS